MSVFHGSVIVVRCSKGAKKKRSYYYTRHLVLMSKCVQFVCLLALVFSFLFIFIVLVNALRSVHKAQ